MTPRGPDTLDAVAILERQKNKRSYSGEDVVELILALAQTLGRLEALEKGDVDELTRLLGLAQANPDLVDVDLWNEQVDDALAALRGEKKS